MRHFETLKRMSDAHTALQCCMWWNLWWDYPLHSIGFRELRATVFLLLRRKQVHKTSNNAIQSNHHQPSKKSGMLPPTPQNHSGFDMGGQTCGGLLPMSINFQDEPIQFWDCINFDPPFALIQHIQSLVVALSPIWKTFLPSLFRDMFEPQTVNPIGSSIPILSW